ncbi:MAG: sugar phosphate isomerase/epimerase family protein [Anaerolineae bacterium]|nr:sugar phosphate isomerase/epimerase [Anaerolineae bacterium]MDW8098028.1 sugar phosphate isomerase/epimerase family protein [Anaerolineae bacterium]
MQRDIKFYVNSWIFGRVPLAEAIHRTAAIGFDGVELKGEPREFNATEVAHMIKDAGLEVLSICGMFPGPGPDDLRLFSHPDAQERQKALDYVKACVDLAKEVGARSVLVTPNMVGRTRPFVSREADLDAAVEPMRKAAEYAGSMDILLTIEPINRYEVCLVNSIAEAIALARRIDHPACRVMGDTFHMQIEEGDGIPNAIRRAGHYWLQHLHAADNTREAPGMGTLPWREILRALHDIEFEGGISLEPLPKGASPYDVLSGNIPSEKLDAELRFGLNHLREMQRIVRMYV